MTGRTVSDVYPSPWLRAEDLGGQAKRVRIERVDVQGIRQRDGSTQNKLIVTFERATKRLICNVTQARALAEAAGTEEFDRWAGVVVVLTATRASNGKLTIAVHGAEGDGAPQTAQHDRGRDDYGR